MTQEKLKDVIIRILGDIAPDADLKHIDPDVEFRDQFDFDSMDFLNFAIAIHKRLLVDIPELHYPRIGTLNGCVEYLQNALMRSAE